MDLAKSERSVFSQNGEDGVIEQLFSVIQPTRWYAVEFTGSNTHLLRCKRWSGLLIEQNHALSEQLRANYAGFPAVGIVRAHVLPENIEAIFAAAGVPRDLDLLSIDVDTHDYHVWAAITTFRPKVMVIEFNGSYPPPERFVMEYHPDNRWDGADNFRASIQSLFELGQRKGYELVYCESTGTDLFFVARQYFLLFGIPDNDPRHLYKPPTYGIPGYGRAPNGLGHPRLPWSVLHRQFVGEAVADVVRWCRREPPSSTPGTRDTPARRVSSPRRTWIPVSAWRPCCPPRRGRDPAGT